MKTIIEISLIYIILVVTSASLMKYILNSVYKGTKHDETWKKVLIKFSIGYFVVGIYTALIYLIYHICNNY